MTRVIELNKPTNSYKYIMVWGLMDELIHELLPVKLAKFWERGCVPRDPTGRLATTRGPSGKEHIIAYDDIVVNRYWYKETFENGLEDFGRVYDLFVKTLGMTVKKKGSLK